MEVSLASVDWLAVLGCIVAGQVISTLWFVVLFGEPWAREFGVATKQEHAARIPGSTYAVQVGCTAVQALCLAILHGIAGVASMGQSLALGGLVALGFCAANLLPGQAFLKRWRVAGIAIGCQVAMILGMSVVLGLFAGGGGL